MTAEALGKVLANGIEPIIVGTRTDSVFESTGGWSLFMRQIEADGAGVLFVLRGTGDRNRVDSKSSGVRISTLIERHVEAACPFSN